MPVRDIPAGPTLLLRQPPLRHGVDGDLGYGGDLTDAPEFSDDGGGRFVVHTRMFDNRTGKVNPACSILAKDGAHNAVRKTNMRGNPYHQWFVEELGRSGKTQSDLARHMGLKPSMVNKIVHGTRKLSSDEVALAASFFGRAAPQFESANPIGELRSVVVVGRAEAGAFREVDELMDDGERVELALPADDLFPRARVVAFDVVGDSMNDLKPRAIQDGDRVVGVAYEDVAHSMPMRDGMVVVVQRTHGGGHMREWSVKQLQIYDDRVEFHPRSLNKRYRPIVVEKNLQADDGVTVEILAVVRRIVNDLPVF